MMMVKMSVKNVHLKMVLIIAIAITQTVEMECGLMVRSVMMLTKQQEMVVLIAK